MSSADIISSDWELWHNTNAPTARTVCIARSASADSKRVGVSLTVIVDSGIVSHQYTSPQLPTTASTTSCPIVYDEVRLAHSASLLSLSSWFLWLEAMAVAVGRHWR